MYSVSKCTLIIIIIIVKKAVRGFALSAIITCEYPLLRSIFVKKSSLARDVKSSSWSGMGSASKTVSLFSFRKSTQKRFDPSGFFTRTIAEAKELFEGSITPRDIIVCTSSFTFWRRACGMGYGFPGRGSSSRSRMSCAPNVVRLVISEKMSLYSCQSSFTFSCLGVSKFGLMLASDTPSFASRGYGCRSD